MASTKFDSVFASKLIPNIETVFRRYLNPQMQCLYLKHKPSSISIHPKNICLRVNQKINMSQVNCFKNFSIWSSKHLDLLKRYSPQSVRNSMIINPFKSYQLIDQGFRSGVSWMLAQDEEEVQKIQTVRFKLMKQIQQQIPFKLMWEVSDLKMDSKTLKNLSKFKFDISGLVVPNYNSLNPNQMRTLILEGRKMGHPLKKLIIQSTLSSYEKTLNEYIQNKIQPIVDIVGVDQTDSYMLVCKVLGRDKTHKPIIDKKLQQLVSQQSVKQSQTMEINGRQWLVCQPNILKFQEYSYIDLTSK